MFEIEKVNTIEATGSLTAQAISAGGWCLAAYLLWLAACC